MTISKKLKAAMRAYYQHRKNQKNGKWNKQADLDAITAALPKNCVFAQYSAGTFWLTWERPRIQTTHSEKNYWCCKVLARWNKKKKDWITV